MVRRKVRRRDPYARFGLSNLLRYLMIPLPSRQGVVMEQKMLIHAGLQPERADSWASPCPGPLKGLGQFRKTLVAQAEARIPPRRMRPAPVNMDIRDIEA